MKIGIIALLIIVAVGLGGCEQDRPSVAGSGLLETTEVIVSAETAGRVVAVRFSEGATVTLGDTLLIIDPSRLELELAAARAGRQVAEANLETARLIQKQAGQAEQFVRAELARVDQLHRSGTATLRQLDQVANESTQASLAYRVAAARVATGRAELIRIDAETDRLDRQLQDCRPVVPMTGVVTEKFVELGEAVAPGKPLATVARLDTLWVKVYLTTGAFASVKLGDRATVDTESGGKTYEGTIVWTSDVAEFTPKNVQTSQSRTNLVYAVKVSIPNSNGSLKVGMPVFVTF